MALRSGEQADGIYIAKTSNDYGSRVPHADYPTVIAPNDEPSYKKKPMLLLHLSTGKSRFNHQNI